MGCERILIIEDDEEIQEMLTHAFVQEGWKLTQAKTGEDGLAALRQDGADCVVLDLMLPGMDGFKVLKKIRADANFAVLPVIICTARGEETDVVTGLELGADDYVVKPYSPRVLAARIRASLRRKETAAALDEITVWQYGPLKLDTQRHACYLDEALLDLSATEFAILAHLISHSDIVFSRQKLITAIRGDDYPVTDRSVDVQILGLRKKLKKAGDMIETIRGVGYRFRAHM
ncbi:MAG: response regulator transcription factor [Treponema sp.]|jgi:two-component system phosphate regulon response regulator PhoB|nr:response regulator transcription factor [Treponema sp.]